MDLPSNLDGKVTNLFYLIVSLGILLALTPTTGDQDQWSSSVRLTLAASSVQVKDFPIRCTLGSKRPWWTMAFDPDDANAPGLRARGLFSSGQNVRVSPVKRPD
jgi:hypothetical protein